MPTTYDRLVAAASDAFAESGLDGVTLDDIAGRAGVHRVTLHRTFPGGREELVLAVLHSEMLRLQRTVLELIAGARDATDALVESIVLVYETMSNNGTLAPLVANPSARSALYGPTAAALNGVGVTLWQAIRSRAVAEGRSPTEGPDAAVVDFMFRIGVSLVAEPGPLRDSDDVRRYLRRYVAPALIAA